MSEGGKDGLFLNKVAAGFLTAGLIFWGANRIADIVVPNEAPEEPAIKIAALPSAAPAAAAPSGPESIVPLIASADVAKGQAFVQQQCSSCHTMNQGGANGVGPNLYNVLGAPMFSTEGFGYSSAAKDKANGKWNYDNMNLWLASPQHFVPGTAMSYAGIKNTQTRADVVAYLRTLSSSPVALPSDAEIKAASAPATPSAANQPAAGAAAPPPDIDRLFATADVQKGQATVQQECSACHTLNKGGANGIGPNLYGLIGSKAFSAPGFSFSPAVKAKAGKPWTPDMLADWLKSPQNFAPGTAMSFPGIKNPQTLADVVAYLNQDSDHPEKLP